MVREVLTIRKLGVTVSLTFSDNNKHQTPIGLLSFFFSTTSSLALYLS